MAFARKTSFLPYLGALVWFSSLTTYADPNKPQYGAVEIINKVNQGDQLEINLIVKPVAGHKVSFDAPWSLELSEPKGVQFANAKLKKDDLQKDLPGFAIKGQRQVGSKEASFSYKMIAFICTTDATRCYREVYIGHHSAPSQ
jgi:hypothetical protein